MELINDPVEDIRESVIMTLTQFVINFWNVKTEEGVQATQGSLRMLMSQFATIIRLDENKKVVTTAVTSLTHLLKTIKESLLVGAGHKENIMACIKQIFTGQHSFYLLTNKYFVYFVIINLIIIISFRRYCMSRRWRWYRKQRISWKRTGGSSDWMCRWFVVQFWQSCF